MAWRQVASSRASSRTGTSSSWSSWRRAAWAPSSIQFLPPIARASSASCWASWNRRRWLFHRRSAASTTSRWRRRSGTSFRGSSVSSWRVEGRPPAWKGSQCSRTRRGRQRRAVGRCRAAIPTRSTKWSSRRERPESPRASCTRPTRRCRPSTRSSSGWPSLTGTCCSWPRRWATRRATCTAIVSTFCWARPPSGWTSGMLPTRRGSSRASA